jgi:hypothetical protein
MGFTKNCLNLLYNKRACPTKNEPQQQKISYLEREKEGCVREREGWGIFKVRLGLGEIYREREIEGTDGETVR